MMTLSHLMYLRRTRYLQLIERMLLLVEDYCREHDKTGGYFRIANEEGFPFLIQCVNISSELSSERMQKTFAYGAEKIVRLRQHPEHNASWLSRNPDENQWGGAIRIAGGFMSFSGLPEYVDEALCLRLAVMFGFLRDEEALTIAEQTGNPYFDAKVIQKDSGRYFPDRLSTPG